MTRPLSLQERERAAMWRVALEHFDRAEQLLLELLAQTDRYGDSPWQVVKWKEMLHHIASLHAHARLLRACRERPDGGRLAHTTP
jgi:hypothetical protein